MKILRVGHESMQQLESYKQCYVYKVIHIFVCFELKKGEMIMFQNSKHAARKIQIDRQVEKKTYTHDMDS